jgi:hypothetical protein
MAFVTCGDYSPPKVLTPVFDNSLGGWRKLKRWARNSTGSWQPPAGFAPAGGSLEGLDVALADRPGFAVLAGSPNAGNTALSLEFAVRFRDDFDEVVWLPCGEHSLASVAGMAAAQLDLRLEGQLDENIARLRDFSHHRRFLFVFDDVRTRDVLELAPGGRSSTLVTTHDPTLLDHALAPNSARPQSAADLLIPAGDEMALTALRFFQVLDADWTEACRAARLVRHLASGRGRNAELYDVMRAWHSAAIGNGDPTAQNESARELAWILERWGRYGDIGDLSWQGAEMHEQMTLF